MEDPAAHPWPSVPHPLSAEERAGQWFVIIVALLALVGGSLYLWRHIAKPFQVVYSGPQFLIGDEKAAAARAAAQAKDTDGDGLNDFEETEIFRTSPYLADSDSDGQGDALEVQSGSDPNCIPGQQCLTSNEDVGFVAAPGFAAEQGAIAAEELARLQGLLEEYADATPVEVRGMLVESGLPQVEVDALSDDEVMEIFTKSFSQLTEQALGASLEQQLP